MSDLDIKLAHWHKELAKVAGEMSTALARRKMRKDATADWCKRLHKVVEEMCEEDNG